MYPGGINNLVMITNNTTQESSVDEKILKRREAIRRSYHKNKEKRSARAKERYKANKQKHALHYSENKEKLKAEQKVYRERNKESRKEYTKKHRDENKEKIRESRMLKYDARKTYAKDWYQENRDRILNDLEVYRENNKEKIKEDRKLNRERNGIYAKRYYQKNKEKAKMWAAKNREKSRKRIAERYYNDVQFKLRMALHSRLHHALKRTHTYKSKKTLELLGCDLDTLKRHIEAQFVNGMSWENYNHETWHIDHIKPCNVFDLSDTEQQKQCFHYTNLRPLWATDNLRRPKDGRDVLPVVSVT